MIGRLLLIQLIAAVTTGVIALNWGRSAAYSAWLGGFSCWLPNALFGLRLWLSAYQSRGRSSREEFGRGADFFLGEFIKVAATLVLLFASSYLYAEIVWLALLAGVVAVLKSFGLLFFWLR